MVVRLKASMCASAERPTTHWPPQITVVVAASAIPVTFFISPSPLLRRRRRKERRRAGDYFRTTLIVELCNNRPMGARLQVLAAAVLFGTTGTAQALGAGGVSPLSVGAARIVVGGAALGCLA